jgi:DNA-binding NtrC family response regulator
MPECLKISCPCCGHVATITVTNDPLPAAHDVVPGMTVAEAEKQLISAALVKCGSREAAAKSLGIGQRTLYRKIKEYGIQSRSVVAKEFTRRPMPRMAQLGA